MESTIKKAGDWIKKKFPKIKIKVRIYDEKT